MGTLYQEPCFIVWIHHDSTCSAFSFFLISILDFYSFLFFFVLAKSCSSQSILPAFYSWGFFLILLVLVLVLIVPLDLGSSWSCSCLSAGSVLSSVISVCLQKLYLLVQYLSLNFTSMCPVHSHSLHGKCSGFLVLWPASFSCRVKLKWKVLRWTLCHRLRTEFCWQQISWRFN